MIEISRYIATHNLNQSEKPASKLTVRMKKLLVNTERIRPLLLVWILVHLRLLTHTQHCLQEQTDRLEHRDRELLINI